MMREYQVHGVGDHLGIVGEVEVLPVDGGKKRPCCVVARQLVDYGLQEFVQHSFFFVVDGGDQMLPFHVFVVKVLLALGVPELRKHPDASLDLVDRRIVGGMKTVITVAAAAPFLLFRLIILLILMLLDIVVSLDSHRPFIYFYIIYEW